MATTRPSVSLSLLLLPLAALTLAGGDSTFGPRRAGDSISGPHRAGDSVSNPGRAGDPADGPPHEAGARSARRSPEGSVAATQATVERVGEGIVSTEGNETFPFQDPVDGSLWFSRYEGSFDAQELWRAAPDGDGWAEPERVPFSGTWGDRAPRFSPDGSRLYFSSNRPVEAGGSSGDFNVWVARRDQGASTAAPTAWSAWGEPELVPAPVSLPGVADYHNAVTADGTIYLASPRDGGAGRSDIYRIARGAAEGVNLGPPVNDEHSQPDLWVALDGSWMILAVTDHPSGLGGDDLYVSRFADGAWSAPRNLGAPVNSAEYEYGPSLSRDGRFVYFTSHRDGSADVYRVAVEAVMPERSR